MYFYLWLFAYSILIRFSTATVDASEEVSEEPDENIDPYDLMDAVDIIPLIAKDFFEQIVRIVFVQIFLLCLFYDVPCD